MNLLSQAKEILLDFLFPREASVIRLESLSSGELLKLLPSPPDTKDEDVIALTSYQDSLVKEIVWEIKYKGNEKMAAKVAEILYDVVEHELSERILFENFSSPLLIPVPISDKRRNERGWNQTELICSEMMKLDNTNLLRYKPKQLVKHFHTEPQTTKGTKSERLENLKNSMKVLAPSVVAGQNIILLDDVTTTGATFAEACRALKAAGARKILCLAFAH